MNSEILQQNLIYTANVQRGRRLEYLTIGWNSLEAVAAVAAGLMAGSIALVGFGIDSVIEVSSGAILLWRLFSGEHREQLALKLVGISFLALAAYIGFDVVKSLWFLELPEESYVGIAIAALSTIVMPLLARAKRRVRGKHQQPRDAGGFAPNRHLRVSFDDFAHRFGFKRAVRLVVG